MYQARNTTGEIVALKKMRMERQKDGIPVSELQEMTILLGLENENIVKMNKIAVLGTDQATVTSEVKIRYYNRNSNI